MRKGLPLVAAFVPLLLLPLPVTAQERQGPASLDGFADHVENLWMRGDAPRIARAVSPAGVFLDLGDGHPGVVGRRHATAALRDLFDAYETGSVEVSRPAERMEAGRTAYLDLIWRARPHGVRDPVALRVFVDVRSEGDGWSIREIRLRR